MCTSSKGQQTELRAIAGCMWACMHASVLVNSQMIQQYYILILITSSLSIVQVVMSAAQTLADITDEKQLPWDYLSALIVLFLIMVCDRVFYALGSHLGKFVLFLMQLLLFIPFTMRLFWSPATGPLAHTHLRVFLLLKCVSFTLNALQLRSGFPPRASFDGGGRQRFMFFATPDIKHQIGFYVFQVCSLSVKL